MTHDKPTMNRVRESRLVDKNIFDDPNEILEAGSNEELDLIAEWSREEMSETVQRLDAELFEAETELAKLREELKRSKEMETRLRAGYEPTNSGWPYQKQLADRVEALEAKLQAANELLQRYGDHDAPCLDAQFELGTSNCICGFANAIEASRA